MTESTVSSSLSEQTVERLQGQIPRVEDRDSLVVRSPFTDDELGTVPACQPADVTEAVSRARAAQSEWARRSVAERAEILQSVADEMLANESELLDIVQLEGGKSRIDAHAELLSASSNRGTTR